MVTPNDIATKDFKKVAVGYSPEEVDTFLDDIYEDYEKLYNESLQSKTKTEVVQEDTDRLRNLEKTLERTLSLAEAAAEETKEAAKAEAEQIIDKAKLERDEILSAARTKVYELEQEIAALQNRYELMRARVKLLLYAEIELLDKNEILAEKDAAKREAVANEQPTKSKNEIITEEAVAKPMQKEEQTQTNPTAAKTDKNPPSRQDSEPVDMQSDKGTVKAMERKPSVKEKLDRYKAEARQQKEAERSVPEVSKEKPKTPQKNGQTVHKQPKNRNRKPKER